MSYRVALTADAVRPDGSSIHGDLGLDRLEAAGIEWHVLPSAADPIPANDLGDVDAVLSFGHARFDAATLSSAPRLRHIARFGAGYETIDVEACTEAGVVVTNTPDGIRRPLAVAGLTMLLACSTQLLPKDRITRESAWEQRERFRGAALDGATLGIIGFGSVGAELARLAAPLGLRIIGNNRSGQHPEARALGVDLVDRSTLLAESDYVVLCAALTPSSAGMIGAAELAVMKPSAFLINIGRGKLVDTDALRTALSDGVIAGAGLDVFEPEPLAPDDPILAMPNVVLSPHALCWTADFTRDVSASAIEAVIAVAADRRPEHAVNPEVFEGRLRSKSAQRATETIPS